MLCLVQVAGSRAASGACVGQSKAHALGGVQASWRMPESEPPSDPARSRAHARRAPAGRRRGGRGPRRRAGSGTLAEIWPIASCSRMPRPSWTGTSHEPARTKASAERDWAASFARARATRPRHGRAVLSVCAYTPSSFPCVYALGHAQVSGGHAPEREWERERETKTRNGSS